MTLGEEDHALISSFESPQQLIDAIQSLERKYSRGTVYRILKGIKPQLTRLQTVTTVLVLGLGSPKLSMACLWGSVTLLIELASQSEVALTKIAAMLNDLGQKLSLFEIYNESFDLSDEILENLFDLLVDLVKHTARAIKHFRKNDIETVVSIVTWTAIQNSFGDTLDSISSTIAHIQKIIEAENVTQINRQLKTERTNAQMAQSMARLNFQQTNHVSAEDLKQCSTLPFPRNPAFYSRADILADIARNLRSSEELPGIRSVAIWGTGGIGKTQVALEYANLQHAAGVPVVLWISSETEVEVSKCFTDAAKHLDLPDYKEINPPDQNRLIVMQWLMKTSRCFAMYCYLMPGTDILHLETKWLLIFDNVDERSILQQNWPVIGNGSILVTCRSEYLAAAQAAVSIEIPTFNEHESSELLLRIINRQNIGEEETAAARRLGEELGGLALALDIMAKQVRSRKKLIREFLPYYLENRIAMSQRPKRGADDPYYKKDLLTVWKTAFEQLSPNAASMMDLICFVAPESIPQSLFRQKIDLDSQWSFVNKVEELEDAEMELVDMSLIKINEKTSHISIHRLTQRAYYDEMNEQSRIAAANATYELLRHAFPDRSLNGHLYTKWRVCEQLIQHVLALRERYLVLYNAGYDKRNEDFTILIMDGARYIEEVGNFITCERIVTPLLARYNDKESMTYAYVCIEAGTLYDRTGRSVPSFDVYETVYKLRLKNFDPMSNDMANGFSLMNLGHTGLWRGEEALEYINKAIHCMTAVSTDEERAKKYNADRFWRNRGRTNYLLKRYGDAKYDFGQAEKYQLLMHGKDSHYDGESAYMFAKIHYREKNWSEALRYAKRAYDCMVPGKPNHATIVATRFLQGIIYIAMGEMENQEENDMEAVRYFSDALSMAQLNEARRGNQGESARVKWRLSQVLARQGLVVEAQTFLKAAEDTKQELLATGLYPTPEEEDESWNAFVGLLYR